MESIHGCINRSACERARARNPGPNTAAQRTACPRLDPGLLAGFSRSPPVKSLADPVFSAPSLPPPGDEAARRAARTGPAGRRRCQTTQEVQHKHAGTKNAKKKKRGFSESNRMEIFFLLEAFPAVKRHMRRGRPGAMKRKRFLHAPRAGVPVTKSNRHEHSTERERKAALCRGLSGRLRSCCPGLCGPLTNRCELLRGSFRPVPQIAARERTSDWASPEAPEQSARWRLMAGGAARRRDGAPRAPRNAGRSGARAREKLRVLRMGDAGSPEPNSAARARAPSRALIKTHAGGGAASRPSGGAARRARAGGTRRAAAGRGEGLVGGSGSGGGEGRGEKGAGGGRAAGRSASGRARAGGVAQSGAAAAWVGAQGFHLYSASHGGVLRVPPVQASRQLRRPAAQASGGVTRGSVRCPEWAGGGNGVRVGAGAHTRLRPHRERRRWRAAAAEARARALRLCRRQQQERQRRGGERLWRREQQEAEAEAAAGTWDDPVRGCEHQRG